MFHDKKDYNKQSDANDFVIVLNLLLNFTTWLTYLHIDHATMTCVAAYLNLRNESHKHGKLRDF